MHRRSYLIEQLVATSSVVLASFGAQAQVTETTPSVVGVEGAEYELEEIVVTAERRSADLMSTSLAASVLSESHLTERQIVNLDALQFNTPSLSVSNFGQANLLNIRGVGRTEVSTNAAAGVPIYRDGVAVFNAYFASNEPYFDIKSVQVLRGPQGTFAGQNSTGGAIFVTSNDPDLTQFGGFGEIEVGSFDRFGIRGALNVPTGDTFALRFSGDTYQRDSFYDYSGSFTGHPGDVESAAGRIGALWAPNSSFSAVLKVDYDYVDTGANTYAAADSTDPLYNIASNANLYAEDRFVRTTANLNYVFANGAELRSISGYQDGETKQGSDFDGTDVISNTLDYRATERIISQEFNLVSPDDGRFQYVLGAYYSDSEVGIPEFLLFADLLLLDLTSELKRRNSAIFANFSYAISPKLRFELGGRFNRATVDQDLLTVVSFAGFPLGSVAGPQTLPDDDKFTGKAGMSYQFNDNNYLYALVSSGYKNSGLNTDISAQPSFDGETLTSYEVGYKTTLLERLAAQVNVYHFEYENYQMSQVDPMSGQTVISNVPGDSTSDGIELQLNAIIGATSFNLSAAYAESELPVFFTVDPRDQGPPGTPVCPAGGPSSSAYCLDLTGHGLPYQPERMISVGVDHVFDTSIGTFTPRLDIAYFSDQYTRVFQTPVLDELESRTVMNAQVTFLSGDWTAMLYASNLLDEEYVAAKVQGSQVLRVAGLPRQIGLRIRRDF